MICHFSPALTILYTFTRQWKPVPSCHLPKALSAIFWHFLYYIQQLWASIFLFRAASTFNLNCSPSRFIFSSSYSSCSLPSRTSLTTPSYPALRPQACLPRRRRNTCLSCWSSSALINLTSSDWACGTNSWLLPFLSSLLGSFDSATGTLLSEQVVWLSSFEMPLATLALAGISMMSSESQIYFSDTPKKYTLLGQYKFGSHDLLCFQCDVPKTTLPG